MSAAAARRADPLVPKRIRLPRSVDEWLEQEAARRGLSFSAYVRSHFISLKARQQT